LIRWQGERSVEGRQETQSILEALRVPQTVLYQALWEVAYKAHRDVHKDSQAALVTEDLLDGILKVYFQERDKVETFLDYCQSANGLLMLQGTISTPGKPLRKVYAFPHLTFEEYLAARYLADRDPEEYVYELVGKSDRWREALKLLGEHLCFGAPQRPTMIALLDALSNPDERASIEERANMTWLAGDLLVLYNRAFPSKPARAADEIFVQLKACALAPEPDARVRANCADLADELGYVPEDLHTFVPVQQGDMLCYFGKYPVTNSQYARFLEADDFHAEKYWIDFPKYADPEKGYTKAGTWGAEGWQWLQKNWDGHKKLAPGSWADLQFGIMRPNAPVVGISWYEANAYCKWLLANWDKLEEGKQGLAKPAEVRLPIESEWVLAAGGEENNRFAFGELKDLKALPRYANTVESGIQRTTPVWMYPKGISPAGVMDMSGNVFEWQTNYSSGNQQFLTRRGGSWINLQDLARVSYRNVIHPFSRGDGMGFRLFALPS
jgi:formylglycine-generating enzyme required for sulfatase activity